MLQSSFADGLTFDLFYLRQDDLATSAVDVCRGKILHALVRPAVLMSDIGISG